MNSKPNKKPDDEIDDKTHSLNRKINIYPIEINIETDGNSFKARAYKLSSIGMMLEVFVNTFSPQQHLYIKWTLPVDKIFMEDEAIVIKKYSQQHGSKIQYLMEIHFKNLKPQHQSAIESLLERVEVSEKKIKK